MCATPNAGALLVWFSLLRMRCMRSVRVCDVRVCGVRFCGVREGHCKTAHFCTGVSPGDGSMPSPGHADWSNGGRDCLPAVWRCGGARGHAGRRQEDAVDEFEPQQAHVHTLKKSSSQAGAQSTIRVHAAQANLAPAWSGTRTASTGTAGHLNAESCLCWKTWVWLSESG